MERYDNNRYRPVQAGLEHRFTYVLKEHGSEVDKQLTQIYQVWEILLLIKAQIRHFEFDPCVVHKIIREKIFY
jgi:hypothetical protein